MTRLTMFHKIILGFILVIFAILFSFTHVWIKTQNELKENRIKLTESQIKFAFHNVNNMIEQVWQEQKNLVNNEYLKALSQTVTENISYETVQNMTKLQSSLNEIKIKYGYISTIQVYIPSRKKEVSLRDITDLQYSEYINLVVSEIKGIQYQADDKFLIINLYSDIFASFEKMYEMLPTYYIRVYIDLNTLKEQMENILPPNSKYLVKDIKNMQVLFGDSSLSIKDMEALINIKNIILTEHRKNEVLFGTGTHNLLFLVEVPAELINPSQMYFRNQIVIFILFSGIVLLIYIIFTKKTINLSFRKLINAFKTVQNGNFEHAIEYKKPDEFSFLYDAFNIMISRITALIEEVYIQKINIQKAELKQLQYQINPHFLYNTLAIVHRMIKFNDYDSAAKMSRYLSKFYQYITRTGIDTTPLIKEYEHVINYINIQKIRFLDKLTIAISELPENLKGLIIPRLIIQPLVENAFKYGLNTTDGTGRISISFTEEEGLLIIRVDDDGQNVSEDVLTSINEKLVNKNRQDAATGILNVHRRIQIQFGPESGIRVSRNQWGGLSCAVYINIKGGSPNVQNFNS